jgi:hypothetical protein
MSAEGVAPVPHGDQALRSLREPALPGVPTAARTALVELWYHPWPALVANLVWTAAVLLAVGLGAVWPLGGLLLLPLVALPVAGAFRVSTRITRGEPVEVRDALHAWRTHGRRAAILGLGTVLAGLVLAADVVIGLAAMGGPVGWALATGAGWALAGGWVLLLHVWPVLLDPINPDRSVRSAVRLGLRTAMLFPGRAVALTFLSTVVLLSATVLFALLATFGLVWVALLASAVVLPAADRLTRFRPPQPPASSASVPR